uniref:Uncharacterized protein LOC111110832 n=1 Tax=Crassostrea virginica TaxID=6565 RepID=A0A8B8BJQ4_CRAVI|nr:uncharacterized protein LOC111110832 [Crassostrea virginica]
MDYFNGYGLPRLSRDFSTGDQLHQQSGDRHISRQSSGSWRNMLGEQEDTRKIYLYKGSDASVKPADENKKTKTGIYLFILILIALLAISLVAVATLSTFLFLIDDNSDDDQAAATKKLNPTHHCQVDTPEPTQCADGWLFSSRSCYRVNLEPLNWNDAEDACQRQDSTLVEISDPGELGSLNSLFSGDFWIGGRLNEEDGTWIHSCSNTTIIFELEFGQTPGNCLGMISKPAWKFTYPGECDTLLASICEGNYPS